MNYSEFYGTGSDARNLRIMLIAYDEEYARKLKAYPQKRNQIADNFKSYSKLVISELNSFSESGESAPSNLRMLGIVFKKNLNIAAKYEMINNVELKDYLEAVSAFYVSQNINIDEHFDDSESSKEIHNRISTAQDNPTGIRNLDSFGNIVR